MKNRNGAFESYLEEIGQYRFGYNGGSNLLAKQEKGITPFLQRQPSHSGTSGNDDAQRSLKERNRIILASSTSSTQITKVTIGTGKIIKGNIKKRNPNSVSLREIT